MKKVHSFAFALAFTAFSTSAFAQIDLQTCANLVNQYCTTNFAGCFEDRVYQKVTVTKGAMLSANSLGMEGTVIFLDLFGVAKNNQFMATFTQNGSILEARFAKYNTVLGSSYWEYCNHDFNINPTQPANNTATYKPDRYQENQQFINKMLDINQQMVNDRSRW